MEAQPEIRSLDELAERCEQAGQPSEAAAVRAFIAEMAPPLRVDPFVFWLRVYAVLAAVALALAWYFGLSFSV